MEPPRDTILETLVTSSLQILQTSEDARKGFKGDPPGPLATLSHAESELPRLSETRRIRQMEPPKDTILETFITSSLQNLQTSELQTSEDQNLRTDPNPQTSNP